MFLSHVLHQQNREECLDLLRKSRDVLKSGGLVVVQAMFGEEGGWGSKYASLHDLLSLLVFPGGKNHSVADTMYWMELTGFRNMVHRKMSVFNSNSLVTGEKPRN